VIGYTKERNTSWLVEIEDFSAMRILIVDGSEDTRELIRAYLTKSGCSNFLFASSADQAYQLLRCDEETSWPDYPIIDLILMDITMPDITGSEACNKIRTIECYKDTPIIMLSAAADIALLDDAFSNGATDYIKKPIRKIELLARICTALRLKKEMASRKAWEKEIIKLATQLKAANKKLNRLSMTDGLTGIANRRLFDKKIEHEWRRALRAQQPLSLIMIDIDYFKLYNDNFGHQAGDQCLKQVATVLTNTLRRPADFVARFGGEEFIAIIPETNSNAASKIAEALRSAIAALQIPHTRPDKNSWVTVSLGVSGIVPDTGQLFQELINKSDIALYKAKQLGRNRVVTL